MKETKWQYRLLRFLHLIDDKEIKQLCLEENCKIKLSKEKKYNSITFWIIQNDEKYFIEVKTVIAIFYPNYHVIKKEILQLMNEELNPQFIVRRLYYQLGNRYVVIPDIEITEVEDGSKIYRMKGIIIQ